VAAAAIYTIVEVADDIRRAYHWGEYSTELWWRDGKCEEVKWRGGKPYWRSDGVEAHEVFTTCPNCGSQYNSTLNPHCQRSECYQLRNKRGYLNI
jgi:hypothetical protein